MPSPDIRQYVDLTVFDKQPTDIYDEAVKYSRTALPDWTPVDGSIEDAMLQSAAMMTGFLAGAINRLPSGVFEALLQLMQITRYSGAAASGSVTVQATNSFGNTLAAGTRFGYYDNSNPDDPILYTFDTVNDLSIPSGSMSGVVAVTAGLSGEYPALATGTPVQVLTPTAFIQSAVLTADIDRGSGAESDSDYFSRSMGVLSSYSSALVLPTQYEQYMLSTYSAVYRSKAYTRVNPLFDGFSDALQNGFLTVYACGVNGASISAGSLSSIQSDLLNRSVAGLNLTIKDPTIVPMTCAVTVTYAPGYIASEVGARVKATLEAHLHPDSWDWNAFIYYNEIISLVDNIEGVGRVVSLTIPTNANLVDVGDNNRRFAKKGSLPRVTATVTVT